MSSDEERELIKLRLLGVESGQSKESLSEESQDQDSEASGATREKIRNEILARRQRYLASKRTQPIYTPKRKRWGHLPVILIALAGITVGAGLAVRNVTATQDEQHKAYALRMLDNAERFDQQDLAALTVAAASADDLLPAASMIGVASNNWDRLFTASRAVRCLFTARTGNVELAIEQIEATRQLADKLADQTKASEPRLIANLCLGKAGQSVCELLVDMNGRERAMPFAEVTINALQDAYAGLAQSPEIASDNYAILAASLQLDLARLRTRGIKPEGTSLDAANAAIEIAANLAREHLQSVVNRGGGWWIQQLRLDAHDLLMKERSVRSSRIESPEIRELLGSVDDMEAAIAPALVAAPELSTALMFQSAIYISNLNDLLESSLKDDQREEFSPQVIDLRGRVIAKLQAAPVYSRTHLHYTNLIINFARRMETNCQMASFTDRNGGDPSEYLAAAKLDAQSLEAQTGALLSGKQSQLSTARQMLAAILLQRNSDEELRQYSQQYPPQPDDQTLIDEIRILVSE